MANWKYRLMRTSKRAGAEAGAEAEVEAEAETGKSADLLAEKRLRAKTALMKARPVPRAP